MEKVLILTNLSWVRNPYQSEVGVRPNPNPFRNTMFNVTDIQTLRHLNEKEVREINFIIKSRALRYIGAAREEWLYPERHVTKSDWNRYGHGYLLMPDPRSVAYGGETIIGYQDGTATALIASSQQKILAFAAASLLLITDSAGHENTCQLDSMAVQPEARRQGLATALLHAIRNWAAQNNARHLTLEVRAGNAPAIALYHRLGLRPEGRRPRYYAHPEEDAVVLGIPLP